MRRIDTIAIHQSDSTWGTATVIDDWHRARGWKRIGYHRVILNGHKRSSAPYDTKLDGMIQAGRSYEDVGAHVAGHNAHSIGICLIGKGAGLTSIVDGAPWGGYITAAQWAALVKLVRDLMERFGVQVERVLGHREFPKVAKSCPGFDVQVLRDALKGKP